MMLSKTFVFPRFFGLLGTVLLLLNVMGLSTLSPQRVQAQEPAVAGISVTANGKRYNIRPGAQEELATLVETGQAPPPGSILGPDDTAFWIEHEPIIWNDYGEPAQPQVWRIVQGKRDGSNGQVVLTSAVFYAAQSTTLRSNSAPNELTLSLDGKALYFDPCSRGINFVYCVGYGLDLQSKRISSLAFDAWGRVSIAPDGLRAFFTILDDCMGGGRFFHTYIATPTGRITLGTGMPGDIFWLSDERLLFSMIDDWTCDNRAETNRIRLSAADGTKIRDLALDVKALEVVASPDESYVAYLKGRYNASYDLIGKELWIVGMDGTGLRKLVDLPADATDLRWEVVFTEPDPAGRRPLIVIPGIMGSQLWVKSPDPREIWPAPFLSAAERRQFITSFNDNVVAVDAVREIGLIAIYKPLLEFLTKDVQQGGLGYTEEPRAANSTLSPLERCQNLQAQQNSTYDLFIFAYDWRRSIEANAVELGKLITCVRAIHQVQKVDLIAHSMGGLVGGVYVQNEAQAAQVRKLITIATPWHGSPALLVAAMSGSKPLNWLQRPTLGISTDDMRRWTRVFTGAQQLLPTETYVQTYNNVVFKEQGWDINANGRENEAYDYAQLISLLHNKYAPIGTNAASFSETYAPHWQRFPQVEYYPIYGDRGGNTTISTIIARKMGICETNASAVIDSALIIIAPKPCYGTTFEALSYAAGDGTVPVASAAPAGWTTYVVRATWQDAVPIIGNTEHTNLVKNEAVWEKIRLALAGQLGEPLVAVAAQSAPNPGFYVTGIGMPMLAVTDLLGNTIGSEGTEAGSDPVHADYHRLGDQAHALLFPAGAPYTITLRTGTTPFYLEINRGTGDSADLAVRYQDLSLPAHTTAMLRITAQGIEPLYADIDGDGDAETEIAPTASISGAAAADLAPPDVAVAGAGPLNARTVTITATDSTGVRQLFYSLNGSIFQPYTEAVTVDALQQPMIYAFADDLLANRSDIFTFDLVSRRYLPLVRR